MNIAFNEVATNGRYTISGNSVKEIEEYVNRIDAHELLAQLSGVKDSFIRQGLIEETCHLISDIKMLADQIESVFNNELEEAV